MSRSNVTQILFLLGFTEHEFLLSHINFWSVDRQTQTRKLPKTIPASVSVAGWRAGKYHAVNVSLSWTFLILSGLVHWSEMSKGVKLHESLRIILYIVICLSLFMFISLV